MTTGAVAVDLRVGERRRRAFAGAGVVSVATLASGVLTYAFHVLAARSLGAGEYGKVAVLWAAMFLAAIVLFRPIEQTVSRALADRLARGEEVRSVLRSGALACVVAVAVPSCAAVAGRNVIAAHLFGGDVGIAWMLVAGLAFYGAAYLVRGVLGGMRWFGGYGLAYAADTAGRLLLALPLLVVASTSLAAAAVVAGGAAGIFLPILLGRTRLRALLDARGGDAFALGSAARFAAPTAVIAAADQLLVNGGPLLVVLEGGSGASKTAGVVFAATMLVRVPVFVFQGLAASLLPNLTHLHAHGDVARFRRAVSAAAGTLLATGIVIVAGAALFGPAALRVVYGPEFAVGRISLALLGAGVGCYLAAATVSQALLARGSAARAAWAWAASAVVLVGAYALCPGDRLFRIAVSFMGATAVVLALLAVALLREARE